MSGGMQGMNVEVVRGLVGKLNAQAGQINSVIGAVEGIVTEMENNWKGPDALSFQQHWHSEYKKALTIAAQALTDLGVVASKNAVRQESTSSTL